MTGEVIACLAVIIAVSGVGALAIYEAMQSAAASREIDRLDAEIARRKAAQTADHAA